MRYALALLAATAHLARADGDPPPPADDPVKPADQPAAPDPAPADKPADKPADAAADKPAEPPPKQVTVVLANGLLQRQGISPEFTITGGVKLWNSDNGASRWWMGRVRAGVLLYQEPKFLALGISGQYGALGSHALGFEAQLMDVWSGFWGQGGVYPIDSTHGVTIEAGIGYGLFGLEYQRRVSGARAGDQTLSLFVTVPLGVLRVMFKEPAGLIHLPMAAPATGH